MTDKYSDMYDLPHPVSKRHTQMPIEDRAAQFSPFAALTGYEEVIDEAAQVPYEEGVEFVETEEGA